MTTRSIEDIAKQIVGPSNNHHNYDAVARDIAAYLNTLIPEGHVLTRDGESVTARKVLGTLPATKDGCVVGDDCTVVYDSVMVNAELFRSPLAGERTWQPFHPKKCYSTREAALAAKQPAPTKGPTDDR